MGTNCAPFAADLLFFRFVTEETSCCLFLTISRLICDNALHQLGSLHVTETISVF